MKLEAPDYKDVEERHRQMMIKHETTIIAVSDLEKYHAALDKALLRYRKYYWHVVYLCLNGIILSFLL